jgi:hypothetical protein
MTFVGSDDLDSIYATLGPNRTEDCPEGLKNRLTLERAYNNAPGQASVEPMQRHVSRARGGQAERLGRALGEIDDAAMGERPAIVHTNDDRAPVLLVHDPKPRPERQGAMSRRHVQGVEPLPACRLPAVEAGPVPGGGPALDGRAGLNGSLGEGPGGGWIHGSRRIAGGHE